MNYHVVTVVQTLLCLAGPVGKEEVTGYLPGDGNIPAAEIAAQWHTARSHAASTVAAPFRFFNIRLLSHLRIHFL